jgi:hypothetical protein
MNRKPKPADGKAEVVAPGAIRGARGHFLPGNPAKELGAGRPKVIRPKSAPYLQILAEELTEDRWRAILQTAITRAIEGDTDALKFFERTVLPIGFEPITSEKCDPLDWGNMSAKERAVALAAWVNRYLAEKKTVLERGGIEDGEQGDGETIDVG